jgi:hypothetical protein
VGTNSGKEGGIVTAHPARRRALIWAAVAIAALTLAVSAAGCARSESRARIEVAATYVRASVTGDYAALADVIASDARSYAHALAAVPQPEGTIATLGDETWKDGALTIEIGFGEPVAYLRLSPPKDGAPDDVVVESWNDQGARASGTITIEDEGGQLVVTAVDGEPITEVMARGRSLW